MPPQTSTDEPLHVFCSYAHEDEELRKELEKHLSALKRNHAIDTWEDRKILAGMNWQKEIHDKINEASIILLLVSPDFCNSEYCWQAEMRRALERHDKEGTVVIPILLRPADWQGAPFGHLAVLPSDGSPVTLWANRDQAFVDIAQGIRKRVEEMKSRPRVKPKPERVVEPPSSSVWTRTEPFITPAPSAVNDFLRDRPKDVLSHMKGAVQLLEASTAERPLNLEAIQNVSVFFLQEMLGSGSKVEWGQDRAILDRVLPCLREVVKSAPAPEGKEATALYEQIVCVLRCLSALHTPDAPAPEHPTGGDEALMLLPAWVQVHERWSAISRASEDPDERAEALWAEASRVTQVALIPYLARRHKLVQAGEAEASLPSLRILHCIWFCLLLLREDTKGTQTPRDPFTQEVRAGISHVLQESLRFLCFGDRQDYHFDTRTYTRSLRVLVVHHAGLSLDLKGRFQHGIQSLLEMISKEGGVNRYPPAEHLQHILETYMAGHFLLSVRLLDRSGQADQTIADVLSSSPLHCHRAFTLAVLFHDVGHLFLTALPKEPGTTLGLRVAGLMNDLNDLGIRIRDAFSPLAQRCAAEMQIYMDQSEADAELRAWLAAQLVRPGHGLLGAWYLHRFFRTLYPAGEVNASCDAVLRDAARAIMLHNALSVPIDAARDPIAAVLVLCDEIFEWDPSQPVTPSSIGRSLHVIATEVPAHEPRDRSIRLPELSLGDVGGSLAATIDLRHQAGSWPQIHIEMQGPQRLQIPVFQLWYRKSRNLGRIRRAPSGFGPVLVMTSHSPFEGQLNKILIERLLHDPMLSPEEKEIIEAWFRELRVTVQRAEMTETARLGPFEDKSLCAKLESLRSAYVEGIYRVADMRPD